MQVKNSNQINNFLSSVIKESTLYIAFIEGITFDQGLTVSKTRYHSEMVIKEVSQALQKHSGISDDDIDQHRLNVLKQSDNIKPATDTQDMLKDTDKKIRAGGILHDALILCKKQGVYPYYTSHLFAAALYYEMQSKENTYLDILKTGLSMTEVEKFDLEFEPEMVFMIKKAFGEIIANEFFIQDHKKLDIIKTAYEEGFRNEAVYRGCARSLIKSFLTVTNKNDEKSKFLFKIADSLAGGTAGCNDGSCGAYCGAMVIISMLLGRELDDLDNESGVTDKMRSNAIGRKIHDTFIEAYGSIICTDIHQKIFGKRFNFRKDNEMEDFDNAGAHCDKCPAVVGMGSAWLCKELYEEALLPGVVCE